MLMELHFCNICHLVILAADDSHIESTALLWMAGMGTLAQLGGCPVLMCPDLNVAETTRFAGALEGVIGKADGLSGVAVISD